MDMVIMCDESALEHIDKTDIEYAFNNVIKDRLVNEYDNIVAMEGPARDGTILEILYRELGEDNVYVFYAMKCRDSFDKCFDD